MSSFGLRTESSEVVQAFASRVKGRTFLVTGASVNGLGAAIAIALAQESPEHIILVGRTKAKIDPVVEEIAKVNPKVKAIFVQCELSDFDSVRKAGAAILDDEDIAKIDVIINNAGIMAVSEYSQDKQGYELQLSSNHLGHFLLTTPHAQGPRRRARVAHRQHEPGPQGRPFRFDDYNFSGGRAYEPWTAYGQSKTANILYSVELARRLAGRGIRSYAVHPGGILGTGLASHLELESLAEIPAIAERNNGWRSFPPLDPARFKTASQGAACELAAALDPSFDDRSGSYVLDCQIGEALDYATDAGNAKKLWILSEELVGQKFDF
ncbi:hypothetical protein KJ359_006951 [Pestalotiopsis sp. 9143b]|nr:hypothetical protein KJ359_006951 [Pestalotiopsis sp. 9143b]